MPLRSFLDRVPGWVWWCAALAWAAGIFMLSARKGDQLPKVDIPYLDKVVHFTLFGIQAVLLYLALRTTSRLRPLAAAALAFVATSLYGGSDEIHQMTTPGRSPDLHDWAADSLGASLVIAHSLLRRRNGP